MVKFYRNYYQLCYKCMRITTLLIAIQISFAGILLADNSHAQTIQINLTKATIKQVFTTIEDQAKVTFVYNEKALAGLNKIDVKINNKPLSEVLKTISALLPLEFKQSGMVIGVSRVETKSIPKQFKPELLPPVISAPNHTISGKVLNEFGMPLQGASVKIKNANIGTITDNKGLFTLRNVPDDAIAVISYIGYETKEVSAANDFTVTLSNSDSKLDEIHVIGYGTTTQRLNTGSVAKVTSDEISQQPVSNPLAALQGRVAGLNVTQTSGSFGSSFTVELRGQNSLATGGGNIQAGLISTPLFIIDGIPFAPNNTNLNNISSTLDYGNVTGNAGLSPFNSINPNDIESIEVLKDADATAIYGSRGGNGVILITTKKGKAGKTQFTANFNSGISKVAHLPELMNTQQYLEMRNEAFKNDNITPTIANAPDLKVWDQNRYTNFPKLLIGGTAKANDVQTSLSGGSNNTTFLFNAGFHNETTVFPTDKGSNRISTLLNLNHSSEDKKFKLNLSASYSSTVNNLPANNLLSEITLEPNYPAFKNSNGSPQWSYNGVSMPYNPIAELDATYKAVTNNLLTSVSMQYLLYKGLSVKVNAGYNTMEVNEIAKYPVTSADPQYAPYGSSANFATNNYAGWSAEPQVEYNTVFGDGKLDILAGGTWQSNNNNQSNIFGGGYNNDALLGSPVAAGSLTYSGSSYEYKYQAVFGRINYNWDDKYILNITGRRDGSSRFGPDKQFSNFGALGAAWVFSNEHFAKDMSSVLSYGKLRGSYGITGTDQIANYQYLDSWTATTLQYQGTSGLYPTRLANPDYSWEQNKKVEVGLELGFLKDRILLTTSYYHNVSDNHLVNYALPSQTGFATIVRNFPATILNSGLEFTITSKNISSANFSWNTNANVSFAQNKLASFPNIATSSYNNVYVVGQSLDYINGWGYSGVNPTTGSYVFKDLDNNGTISGPGDYVNLGNFNPKFSGGIDNAFRYKDWQLNFFLEFKKQLGLNYLASVYKTTYAPGFERNVPVELLDRWQQSGDNATFSKYSTKNTGLNLFGSYNGLTVSDASYIRLKSFALNYNVPKSLINKLHLSNLKVYAQGQNLFTITPYKVTDPETRSLYVLPPLRTIIMGIQLTL